MSEDIYTIEQTCRTCLQNCWNNEMVPIFGDSNNDSLDLLQQLQNMKIEISPNDGLPQNLCLDCKQRISEIKEFFQICKISQTILLQYFNNQTTTPQTWDNKSIIASEEYSAIEFLDVENTFCESEEEDQKEIKMQNETDHAHNTTDLHEIKVEEEVETIDTKVQSVNCMGPIKKKCKLNDKRFRKNQQNNLKELNSTDANIITCRKCKTPFSTIEDFNHHEDKIACIAVNEIDVLSTNKSIFNSSSDLEIQLHDVHPTDYLSPSCNKELPQLGEIKEPLKSHDEDKIFKCDQCEKMFKSKPYLLRHKRGAHFILNRECTHCNGVFLTNFSYINHLKNHKSFKKYKCSFCDKSFYQKHHLENHEPTHTGLKRFVCSTCDKAFSLKQSLIHHMESHDGDRPFKCDHCTKDFRHRPSLLIHMKQHRLINCVNLGQGRPFQCDQCGKGYKTRAYLDQHLLIHTGVKPHICDLCDRAFIKKHQLNMHKDSFHNSEIYQCTICNRKFKLQHSLDKHMKVHNEERKYVCSQCGNTFKRASHLRTHTERIHSTGEPQKRPFHCIICTKTFPEIGTFNVHMKLHSAERPFECKFCDKKYTLQKLLTAHQRVHTGEKPYTCDICDRAYMSYLGLKAHVIKHKKDESTTIKIEKSPDNKQ